MSDGEMLYKAVHGWEIGQDASEWKRLEWETAAAGYEALKAERDAAGIWNAYPELAAELRRLAEEVRRLTQANADLRKERAAAVEEAKRQHGVAKGLRLELDAQALEAWAWVASQSMPVEIVLKRWRILGRDSSGYLKFYYADTPLGCVLAAMEGEK